MIAAHTRQHPFFLLRDKFLCPEIGIEDRWNKIFWIAYFSLLTIDHLLREAGRNLGCDSFYFVNYF